MNNEMYPLTIIKDRYNGTYSGGMYLAFNLEYDLHLRFSVSECAEIARPMLITA